MNTGLIWMAFIVVMILSYIVQNTLQSRYAKYSKIRNHTGLTGAEVAMKMLREHGLYDVQVMSVRGQLTDHYDPRNRTVNLSEGVYNSNSIAAAAIAAHECGHAVQDAVGYAPLKLRTALVPVVTFSNSTVQWVLLAGLLLVGVLPQLLWLGIAMFAMSTAFSLITLPVEINASQRAMEWLNGSGVSDYQTAVMARDALKWAAYTYVIAAIGSLTTLLYYISIANRRN